MRITTDPRPLYFNREKIFAKKVANVFLKRKGVNVMSGDMNIAYVNVNTCNIFFNFDKIFKKRGDIMKQMMTFKGLLFHEIHHIKHTVNTKRYVNAGSNLMNLVQILEDGRIETLGVLEYSKLADYFIYAINNVLLDNRKKLFMRPQETIAGTYILMFGRKIYWQDMSLLKKARRLFVLHHGHETVKKVEELVNKYQFETSANIRLDIAEEIHKLLSKNLESKFDDLKGNQSNIIDTTGMSDEQVKELQEKLKDIVKVAIKVNERVTKKLQEDTKDAKDRSSGLKENVDKANKELDKKLDEVDKARQKVRKADTQDKFDKAKRIYNKKQEELTKANIVVMEAKSGYSPEGSDKLIDEMQDLLDKKDEEQEKIEERNEKDLVEDIKAIGRSFDNLNSDPSFTKTQEMEDHSKKLEKGLKKLSTELSKGYVKHQKTGRINVRSYLNRKNMADTKIFNSYKPDRIKETKLLVNIFLDGSGSMRDDNKWQDAVNSVWVLNEALNKDGNKVMIYEFSNNYHLVKRYDEPLVMPKLIGGGTVPSLAITNAMPIIDKYKKGKGFLNVVDIIVTDGEFNTGGVCDEKIKALGDKGHHTILVSVGRDATYSNAKHNAKHHIKINSFRDLVPKLIMVFSQVKKSLIRKVVM